MTGDPKTETEGTASKPTSDPVAETAEKPKVDADNKTATTPGKPRARRAKAKPEPAAKKFERAKFDYSGPPQSVTFCAPEFEVLTVRCHPGKSVMVPKDHKITEGMIAGKLLIKPAQ